MIVVQLISPSIINDGYSLMVIINEFTSLVCGHLTSISTSTEARALPSAVKLQ